MRGNFKVIIKNMKHRKLEKVLIGLQIIITVALFLLNGASYKIYDGYLDSFEKRTSYNSKDILHMKFSLDAFKSEKYLELKEKILDIDGVRDIGFYDFNSIAISDDRMLENSMNLISYLETKGDMWDRDETSIPILRLSKGIEKVIPFKISKGRGLEESDYNRVEKDVIPILIGKNLEDYDVLSIGDVIEGDKNLKVVGVLDKESYWFKFKGMTEPQYINLDDKIIMPYSDDFYKKEVSGSHAVDYYCLLEEGQSENIKNEIERLGEKDEFSLRVESLNEEINEYTSEILKEIKVWMTFLIIILIVIAIGFMFSVMASLVSRKQEIGLRMAVGASVVDVIKILIGEIFVNVMVSGTISIIGMTIIQVVFETPRNYDDLFYMNPLNLELIIFVILLITLVAIIPSIAIVIKIKNKPLRDYIRRT